MLDYESISRVYGEKAEQMEAYLSSLPDSYPIPRRLRPCGRSLQGSISQALRLTISWAWPMPRLWRKGYKAVPDSTSGRWLSFISADQEFASATALRPEVGSARLLSKIHSSPSIA